jgi:DNA invertase Pin-like site-specific DNA recombinase
MSSRARNLRAVGSNVPSRPAIYARISDDREHDELGVARQIRQCRDLAHRLGWPEPVTFVDNDLSAFKRKRRPDWDRLGAAIRAGTVDALLAVHPDRISRGDLRDLEDIIDLLNGHDVPVHTVNAGDWNLTTASGRMNARIIGSVARGESERMTEKIRDKMTELREQGRHHGRTPYGYRRVEVQEVVDGRLVGHTSLAIVDEQAKVVREVADRIIAGWSLRRICTDLDERGVATLRGARDGWRPAVVRQLVTRPTVMGWRGHHDEPVARGDWEPILDRPTWERCRDILRDPARKTTRPGRRYLLGGMIWTSDGQRMAGRPYVSGSTRPERRRPCYFGPHVYIDAAQTDAEVVAQLWEHLAELHELPAPDDAEADAADADITAAEGELRALVARRQRKEIEQVEYELFAQPLRDSIAEAKQRRTVTRGPDLRTWATTPAELRKSWEADELSLADRRDVLAAFIDRVEIAPRRPSTGAFDAERITVKFRS